ncbi:MAG: hypothetical protein ACP5SD_02910 [Elusimicrobiales bacterium]
MGLILRLFSCMFLFSAYPSYNCQNLDISSIKDKNYVVYDSAFKVEKGISDFGGVSEYPMTKRIYNNPEEGFIYFEGCQGTIGVKSEYETTKIRVKSNSDKEFKEIRIDLLYGWDVNKIWAYSKFVVFSLQRKEKEILRDAIVIWDMKGGLWFFLADFNNPALAYFLDMKNITVKIGDKEIYLSDYDNYMVIWPYKKTFSIFSKYNNKNAYYDSDKNKIKLSGDLRKGYEEYLNSYYNTRVESVKCLAGYNVSNSAVYLCFTRFKNKKGVCDVVYSPGPNSYKIIASVEKENFNPDSADIIFDDGWNVKAVFYNSYDKKNFAILSFLTLSLSLDRQTAESLSKMTGSYYVGYIMGLGLGKSLFKENFTEEQRDLIGRYFAENLRRLKMSNLEDFMEFFDYSKKYIKDNFPNFDKADKSSVVDKLLFKENDNRVKDLLYDIMDYLKDDYALRKKIIDRLFTASYRKDLLFRKLTDDLEYGDRRGEIFKYMMLLDVDFNYLIDEYKKTENPEKKKGILMFLNVFGGSVPKEYFDFFSSVFFSSGELSNISLDIMLRDKEVAYSLLPDLIAKSSDTRKTCESIKRFVKKEYGYGYYSELYKYMKDKKLCDDEKRYGEYGVVVSEINNSDSLQIFLNALSAESRIRGINYLENFEFKKMKEKKSLFYVFMAERDIDRKFYFEDGEDKKQKIAGVYFPESKKIVFVSHGTDEDFRIKTFNLKDGESFILIENSGEDSFYKSAGLYKIDVDGKDVILLGSFPSYSHISADGCDSSSNYIEKSVITEGDLRDNGYREVVVNINIEDISSHPPIEEKNREEIYSYDGSRFVLEQIIKDGKTVLDREDSKKLLRLKDICVKPEKKYFEEVARFNSHQNEYLREEARRCVYNIINSDRKYYADFFINKSIFENDDSYNGLLEDIIDSANISVGSEVYKKIKEKWIKDKKNRLWFGVLLKNKDPIIEDFIWDEFRRLKDPCEIDFHLVYAVKPYYKNRENSISDKDIEFLRALSEKSLVCYEPGEPDISEEISEYLKSFGR